MELNSNRRSKAQIGGSAEQRFGSSPLTHQPSCLGLEWSNSAWRWCWLGTRNNHASRWRANRPPGGAITTKDVKNEGTSGDVHENKRTNDNLPDRKDDFSAWSHAILHKNTRTLYQPTAHLPLFEPWGTHLALQNGEAPEAGAGRAPAAADEKPALPCVPFTITFRLPFFLRPLLAESGQVGLGQILGNHDRMESGNRR